MDLFLTPTRHLRLLVEGRYESAFHAACAGRVGKEVSGTGGYITSTCTDLGLHVLVWVAGWVVVQVGWWFGSHIIMARSFRRPSRLILLGKPFSETRFSETLRVTVSQKLNAQESKST